MGLLWDRLGVRGFCCVGLMCLVGSAGAAVRHAPAKKVVALSPYERAVKDRLEFEGLEDSAKTRVAFTRVMDGFRAVYHDAPRDVHAPDAVFAVAELLGEEGRLLGDAKLTKASAGQYEFLRVQYPGSRLRGAAAVAEGRVSAGEGKNEHRGHGGGTEGHGVGSAGGGARAVAVVSTADSSAALRNDNKVAEAGPALVRDDGPRAVAVRDTAHDNAARDHGAPGVGVRALAAVTGIRHWSTASYTRVAIDLGDEVTFEAARVPNPDRIYFDLHGARLGAELVGKSFDVTDDGFLKRIRAAQASGDVTRVVLDVSDLSEYSAFLLPNPYRLIIDIHGGKSGSAKASVAASSTPVEAGAGRAASAAANASGLPAMAVTDGGDAVRPARGIGSARGLPVTVRDTAHDNVASGSVIMGHPEVAGPRTGVVARATLARPVPNTVAAPATVKEVAAVSEAPGRVAATRAPTMRPVVAKVLDRDLGAPTRDHGGSETHVSEVRHGAPSSVVSPIVAGAAPVKAAERTADGETSLVRALGLKIGRIVIDAGHGGHDSGTLGVDGIQEKDVVLDVALRLGKMLHERLGAEIIYTRSDDTFIPLETRTAIANKAQADLFLSIHANSSQDPTARGVETYYLNFTSDPTALDVAARENAVGGQGVHQLSDLVKKIALKDKIAESREFAADVESSLYAGLEKGNAGLKNRGVKKAPFVVLIGANMPSILAEISFVTNARDAGQLREPEYRQRVAESLYNGVAKYEGGLAGARPVPTVRASTK